MNGSLVVSNRRGSALILGKKGKEEFNGASSFGKMKERGERERENMDGNIAKLVLREFQHSVYGDYQCEVDRWMDKFLLRMVIVRICAKFKPFSREFLAERWDNFKSETRRERKKKKKKKKRVYLGSHRDAPECCPFKIACRDISTSYPSKLHAITGILDSTTSSYANYTIPLHRLTRCLRYSCPVSFLFFTFLQGPER